MGEQSVDFDETSPIVYTYLTAVFIPSTKGSLSNRNDQELLVLAKVIDYILSCDPSRACDLLCQQFKAVEQSHHDGSWNTARHLSVVPDNKVTVMADREKDDLCRDERADAKMRKLQQQVSSTRPAAR